MEQPDRDLLGRLVWLHEEVCRRLRAAEESHVAITASLEPAVGGSRDPDEHLLDLAVTLQARVGRLRALRKDRREALRRLAAAYERKLGYQPRPDPRFTSNGRLRIQSVDQTGHRQIS